jgi:hypothetical protein
MKIGYINTVIKNFITHNGIELLAQEINRIINKQGNNIAWRVLTQEEMILAGLRYSEYYTEETTDQEYYNAANLAEKLRNKYNITWNYIYNECLNLGLY